MRAKLFRFDKDARSAFATSHVRGASSWDKAAGFSFWAKSEGDGLAGLQFIYDDDFAVRYDFAFRVRAGEWSKVTVAIEFSLLFGRLT